MLRLLTRNGLRRGLLGGSRPWLLIGVAAGGLRLLGRITSNDEKVVFREELAPGTSLVISHGTEEEPEVKPGR
jgi:hypothetical protein